VDDRERELLVKELIAELPQIPTRSMLRHKMVLVARRLHCSTRIVQQRFRELTGQRELGSEAVGVGSVEQRPWTEQEDRELLFEMGTVGKPSDDVRFAFCERWNRDPRDVGRRRSMLKRSRGSIIKGCEFYR
jgi:hypothetical protein